MPQKPNKRRAGVLARCATASLTALPRAGSSDGRRIARPATSRFSGAQLARTSTPRIFLNESTAHPPAPPQTLCDDAGRREWARAAVDVQKEALLPLYLGACAEHLRATKKPYGAAALSFTATTYRLQCVYLRIAKTYRQVSDSARSESKQVVVLCRRDQSGYSILSLTATKIIYAS